LKKGQEGNFGKVNDIYADCELLVVVHEGGYLTIYRNSSDREKHKYDNWVAEKPINLEYPVKTIKMACRNNTLIVFVEVNDPENLKNNEEYL